MLTIPTMDKLRALKLYGMLKAFTEQNDSTEYADLSFEERIGLLIDREVTERDNRRLAARLKQAKLRQSACMENVDYRSQRGLDKSLMKSLSQCQWIKEGLNILITGPCGAGKSFIACALAHKACLNGYIVRYLRAPRMFQDIVISKGDGSYAKLMKSYAKSHVLVIDDWGLSVLTDHERNDLLEILEDRHNIHSTIMTSQLSVKHWHEAIGNATLADAILDRLVHNAYKIELKGESMRKKQNKPEENRSDE